VVLTRSQGAARVIEPIWHYGARDWFFIGHFAIWAANTWRTLETIGWQHAEPTLRVLAPTLIGTGGDWKPLKDQPYAANCERVEKTIGQLPADWAQDGGNPGLTDQLLVLIRELKTEEACQLALTLLLEGKAKAGTVWDAVHLAAGEMIFNKPYDGGCALHSNTCSNALHYAFQVSADPANRLLVLLQAVGWMCLYRGCVAGEGLQEPKDLTKIAGADIPDDPETAVEEILSIHSVSSHSSPRPDEAASKAFTFAQRYPGSDLLRRAAGRLLPLKSSWNPHDIKFPVAMF